MKRALIALIAVSALSAAFAQSQSPPPRPDPQKFLERLTVVLDLDEYQQGEVKKVLEAQRAKMETQRAEFKASGERPTFEQMKAAHEASKKETEEALSSVLTPEQLKKFDAFMADRGPPPGGPRGPRPDKASDAP
jgi:Spy/CpxP family protein refolding chaperone